MTFHLHGSKSASTVFPGHQMRYDQSALHQAKTIPGCAVLTNILKWEGFLPVDGVTILTSNQVAGFKSHLPDERGIQGLHYSDDLKQDTMPTLDRVTKAGTAGLGCQSIEEPIILLELVSSNVSGTTSVSKYSQNQAAIANVLLKEQFFKSNNGSSRTMMREWKEAANNSVDNSHTFTTKTRADNAP